MSRRVFIEADPQRTLTMCKKERKDGAKVVIRGKGRHFEQIGNDLAEVMIEKTK